MGASQWTYENGVHFFRNTDCPHFPCHEGVDPAEFNCLFCYCPLYALGPRCGGEFRYNDKGVKTCVNCTMLHRGDAGAGIVKQHFDQLVDLARRSQGDSADAAAEKREGE